jgi:rRNA maturation endonuclease Nob1
MPTRLKLKIIDNNELRDQIDQLYENATKITLAKWSLSLSKHLLEEAGIDYTIYADIVEGYKINELWQSGNASIGDIRQSGLKIHKLARESNNEVTKTAIRVVGQAVSSGHVKEHSMVSSDYAIKTIGLVYLNDYKAISKERNWQLEQMKNLVKKEYNYSHL